MNTVLCKIDALSGGCAFENQNGGTPLHDAAWEGHFDTVDALLQAGAVPEAMNMVFSLPPYKTCFDTTLPPLGKD